MSFRLFSYNAHRILSVSQKHSCSNTNNDNDCRKIDGLKNSCNGWKMTDLKTIKSTKEQPVCLTVVVQRHEENIVLVLCSGGSTLGPGGTASQAPQILPRPPNFVRVI